jgi:hypothetical protein
MGTNKSNQSFACGISLVVGSLVMVATGFQNLIGGELQRVRVRSPMLLCLLSRWPDVTSVQPRTGGCSQRVTIFRSMNAQGESL